MTARLLGTDGLDYEGVSLSGFVLDEQGLGVREVPIDLIANGEVVTQLVSGLNGQFDYTNPAPAETTVWQLRLSDYPEASLQLEVASGLRYLLEFRAQAINES